MQVIGLMLGLFIMFIGIILCEVIGAGAVFFIWYAFFWGIFIFLFISIMTKKPGIIHGDLKTYSSYQTKNNNTGIVKKGTFYTKDNTRQFYNKIYFKKNLWSSDSKPLNADCIFFVDFSKFFKSHLDVWGVMINNKYWVFKDDMKFWMRVYIVAWIVSISVMYLIHSMDSDRSRSLLLYFSLQIFPFATFVSATVAFLEDKKLYKERLQLLESEGVPHPLG